jgi:L-ascorbate metabolism protein UlaG (beta-lactamase superfamily)
MENFKLTYVYHSCYVLQLGTFALIFDYYKDSGASFAKGMVHDELLCRPEVLYVLASHSHPDHFNPEVLEWKRRKENIRYIFSSDILHTGKAGIDDALYLKKGDRYEDARIRVEAFGSTDVGISFLVEIDGKRIFHAGDLNNWHWADESTDDEVREAEAAWQDELGYLARSVDKIDLALFPVDPRLGRYYMLGAEQFLSRIPITKLAPMHFGEAYDKANALAPFALANGCRLLEPQTKGQTFLLE